MQIDDFCYFCGMSLGSRTHKKQRRCTTVLTDLVWIVLLVLCSSLPVLSQRWSEQPKQYTVDDGLPTLDAYHIIQDQAGFLWIGTDVGVARFDGYDFSVLTMRDGLPNNDVIRIREDQHGQIWLNSIGPPCILTEDAPKVIDLPPLDNPKYGFDLIETPEGGFWLNYGASYHYLSPDYQLQSADKTQIRSSVTAIRGITKTEGDTVLIYTGTELLFSFNDQVSRTLKLPEAMHDVRNLAYYYSPEGIYFVNRSGLHYWSFHDDLITLLDDEVATGLDLEIIGRQLFLLDPDYGLRVYNLSNGQPELTQHFFPSNFCNSFLIDHEGNLWITSLGDGAYFYPRQIVESNATVLPKAHQRINKLFSYQDQLLLGTFNGRIYAYNPADRSTELWIESSVPENNIFDRVMDIVEMPNGRLLIGKDTGLYELKGDSLHMIASLAIKALFVDNSEGLVMNTQSGCYALSQDLLNLWINNSPIKGPEKFKGVTQVTSARGYSAYQSADETIWTDNTEEGLISYVDGAVTRWKDRSSIFGVHINDMLELPDSTMAFATHGEGLILLKNGDFWVLNEVEQLPSNIVNALHLTDDKLWVATNRGVALIEDLDLPRRQFRIDVYNRNDGLLTEDIADLVESDNQLMLGTQLGLITLPLDQQPVSEVQPRIILENANANGYQLDLATEQTLKHDQNSIKFQFLGISFRSKGKMRYRYRLSGYDRDWASTANRELTYHNLSPGKYTFEVSAVDYKGQISGVPASVSFRITPHFTQRSGFWLIIAVLAIGLLIGGIQSYLSIRERNVLSRLVDEKTAILDRRVQELARSNEELEQFARAASHDLKSPLRNVASFVQLLDRRAKERLQDDEKEFIDLAIQGVKGMERTIDDLLTISRIDQQEKEQELLNFTDIVEEIKQANQSLIKDASVTIVQDTPFPSVLFSKVNAYQLLQNLILNGITYRSEDAPVIRLACIDQPQHWLFSVSDNGIGIAPEFQKQIFGLFSRLHHSKDIPGTGIGLTICKKIVEQNGGQMSVHSEAGKGATFYFSIPKPR